MSSVACWVIWCNFKTMGVLRSILVVVHLNIVQVYCSDHLNTHSTHSKNSFTLMKLLIHYAETHTHVLYDAIKENPMQNLVADLI